MIGVTAAMSAGLWSCGSHVGEKGHEAEKGGEHEHEEAGLIELSEEQGALLGIGVEVAEAGPFHEVEKVGGEIEASPTSQYTVSARSAGIVTLEPGIGAGASVGKGQTIASISARGMAGGDANEQAQVAYLAAEKEVDRLRPLAAEGIVTRRDLNAAEQRLAQAKAATGSGTGGGSRATAPVGGTITTLDVASGSYVEAGAPIATISANGTLRLRADLPEGRVSVLPNITGARFQTAYSDTVVDIAALGGRRVATAVPTAQQGTIPVWFDFTPQAGTTLSGVYCRVWLVGAERDSVITVPAEAIAEQQGKYFVYTKLKPGHYMKRPVELGASDGRRVELRSGVGAGDSIVTRGAQFVRLAESATVAPEGHSHHH